MSKLGAFLVASKKATSAADAYYVVAGLSTLPAFGPVAITLLTPTLAVGGKVSLSQHLSLNISFKVVEVGSIGRL